MAAIGLMLLSLGLLCVLGRTFVWKVTHFRHALAGTPSERTALWDAGTIVSGVVLVLVGGIMVWLALYGSTLPTYPTSRAYTVGTDALVDQTIANMLETDPHADPQQYYLVPVERGDVTATMVQIQQHYQHVWRMRCTGGDWSITCTPWFGQGRVEIDLHRLTSKEMLVVYH